MSYLTTYLPLFSTKQQGGTCWISSIHYNRKTLLQLPCLRYYTFIKIYTFPSSFHFIPSPSHFTKILFTRFSLTFHIHGVCIYCMLYAVSMLQISNDLIFNLTFAFHSLSTTSLTIFYLKYPQSSLLSTLNSTPTSKKICLDYLHCTNIPDMTPSVSHCPFIPFLRVMSCHTKVQYLSIHSRYPWWKYYLIT